MLTAGAVRLSSVTVDGDDIYWNEGRPSEAGRQVVVRRTPDGSVEDAIPEGMSARTLVHEYGGRSFAVHRGTVVFSNFGDQRLYRGDGTAITPPSDELGFASVRYADHEITGDGQWVACVRERHPAGGGPVDVVNDLVAVRLVDGTAQVLAEGHDFFAAPRLSPDGTRLAWLSWDHPNMPWDETQLWVAPIDRVSMVVDTAAARAMAGGPGISVSQPRWSPDGVLHWVTDESGWWRIAREDGGGVAFVEGREYAGPDWAFGQSSYTFLADGTLVAAATERGVDVLEGVAKPPPFTSYGSVRSVGDGIVCIAGSPRTADAVVRIASGDGSVSVLRESQPKVIDDSYISVAEPIEFETAGGRTAHALFYRPVNPDFEGPEGERPPLLVLSHGGPTSATTGVFGLRIQYWTTRGVAVVDVNYGGSTGYGREYRDRLKGAWGIVDVEDCVNAALSLADRGEVDRDRLVIRGGSAGGYTTLAALTFRPEVFAAGSSHYGVADAEALARDTHKFESRYLDGLIGPYPDDAATYRERSPIHHTERLSCPLILFQGLEDKVVPPEQSEMMAEALADKGIPHAYVAFEGEQHGFRQAATIERVAQAELYFLGRVLGFTPADEIEPVKIVHEEALR